jgi:hypothetical protein
LAFNSSGNLCVANAGQSTIEEFNSSGQGSVFADLGLTQPIGLAFDSGGSLYVANQHTGTIEKIDSNGNGSIFASDLNTPYFIAVQVPEPSTWAMVALSIGTLLDGLRLRRRSSRSVAVESLRPETAHTEQRAVRGLTGAQVLKPPSTLQPG